MKVFYMTIGISGSGKSTYLKKYNEKLIVSPDEIRKELTGDVSCQSKNQKVWEITKERVIEMIDKYDYCVLDATNTTSKGRKRFMKDLKVDQKISIVFPLPALDIAYDRVKKDIDKGVDRSNVPKHIIERQIEQYKKDYDKIPKEFDIVLYTDSTIGENI